MDPRDSSSSCNLHLDIGPAEILVWPAGERRPDRDWFDPAALARHGRTTDGGLGRGSTVCFDAGERTLILRHYRRGGMARFASDDRYLRVGVRRSRPWRELALLTRLHAGGMPVPPPVAARITFENPLSPWYRGDLVSGYLDGTRTLAEALRTGQVDDTGWTAIGATIARFHAVGVDHADLNAHNVLLGDAGDIHLIDFDRARLRFPGRWRRRNLARLRRSLDKLRDTDPGLRFDASQWRRLLAGYEAVQ